jgi:transposase
MDERGKFLTPVFQMTNWAEALAGLLQQARERAEATCLVVVVMEPTGLAWLPVAVFMLLHGVTIYLVNSQQVADLLRFYKKHAKSDQIDARVLAKPNLVAQEELHALRLPPAAGYALQRACKAGLGHRRNHQANQQDHCTGSDGLAERLGRLGFW